MDPHYMDTSLKILSIASYFRFMCLNKKVGFYPFIVNFFKKGELSLSLGAVETFVYT